jgi:hypothetical protein
MGICDMFQKAHVLSLSERQRAHVFSEKIIILIVLSLKKPQNQNQTKLFSVFSKLCFQFIGMKLSNYILLNWDNSHCDICHI